MLWRFFMCFRAESQPATKPAIINLEVEVSELEEADKLFSQLKQIKGVIDVQKI